MMLIEVTTVPPGALPVAFFKDHLRLGTGFADDGLQDVVLEAFLRAALAAIEARTGKALLEREFSLTLAAWRDQMRQPLPVAPVSAVSEVVVLTAEGVAHPVAPSRWRLEPDQQQPGILAFGAGLPAVPPAGSIRIGFLAGFGPEWSDLPADLAQAVLMLAAHYYEYRHDVTLAAGCMPFGVTALIERYRSIRVRGGGRA